MTNGRQGFASMPLEQRREIAGKGGRAAQQSGKAHRWTREEALQAAAKGGTSRRGFASMSPEKLREIASMGGKAAHEQGTAHEFTPEEASRAGKVGGARSRRGPTKKEVA